MSSTLPLYSESFTGFPLSVSASKSWTVVMVGFLTASLSGYFPGSIAQVERPIPRGSGLSAPRLHSSARGDCDEHPHLRAAGRTDAVAGRDRIIHRLRLGLRRGPRPPPRPLREG